MLDDAKMTLDGLLGDSGVGVQAAAVGEEISVTYDPETTWNSDGDCAKARPKCQQKAVVRPPIHNTFTFERFFVSIRHLANSGLAY